MRLLGLTLIVSRQAQIVPEPQTSWEPTREAVNVPSPERPKHCAGGNAGPPSRRVERAFLLSGALATDPPVCVRAAILPPDNSPSGIAGIDVIGWGSIRVVGVV